MKRNDILFILIGAVVLVIAWSVLSILQRLNTSTITTSVNEQVVPITPSFDTQTLSGLSQRLVVTPVQQLVQPTITVVTPTPMPTPTPILLIINQASSSGQTATTGGTIR